MLQDRSAYCARSGTTASWWRKDADATAHTCGCFGIESHPIINPKTLTDP